MNLSRSEKDSVLPILHGAAICSAGAPSSDELVARLRRSSTASFLCRTSRAGRNAHRKFRGDTGEIFIEGAYNYVPIDPCQGVSADTAMDLGTRAYVDLEVGSYEENELALPIPAKRCFAQRFSAMVPALTAPNDGDQRLARIRRMAHEPHLLELEHDRIVLVCSGPIGLDSTGHSDRPVYSARAFDYAAVCRPPGRRPSALPWENYRM